jgi:exopolysaccharide biosynthesis polyprenyl glycosylphosphotransferase
MLREQHRFFRSVLIAADLVVVASAVALAYWIRFDLLSRVSALRPPESSWSYATHGIPILAAAPLMLVAMLWAGLYQPRRDQRFHGEAAAIVKAAVVGVGLLIAALSLFRNVLFNSRDYSSLQFGAFGVLVVMMLWTWRASFRGVLRALRRRGWNLRHVAIIGTGRLGQVVLRTIRRNLWTGITPAYFISHHPHDRPGECVELPVRGGLNDLERALESHPVTGVIIALPARMAAEMPDLLARLERFPLDVRIVPDVNPSYLPINMAVSELDGMPVLSVRESPLSGWGRVGKRALDLVGGAAALMVFGLPMIAIAFLVRLSGPGPIVFRQERMSLNGRRFMLYKFRTMTHIAAEQQALRDAGKGTEAWTKADDPRITRVGRFLRRTSLDELPQLFNVLLGEMSLVGPRPERPELIERFRDDWRGYMLRQNVKAGMTGWAQVNGLRGDTSLKKRLQYDLFYIRNWSMMFDVRILIMTVFRGFVHPHAQ